MQKDGWIIDIDALKQAITSRTKAIIVNSPHNPTGTVYTKEEMFQLWRKTREQVYEIRYMEDEYLQSLLEEQKKELIEEILKLGQTDGGYRDMVWKELIESLK